MKRSIIFLFALVLLYSCKSNIEPVKASAGEADFSNYIAIGNSLTAGYSDNSLYRSGQMNSYPSMLAAQFKFAGGGDFKQPLLPGEAGWPSPKLVLGYSTNCLGQVGLGPVPFSGANDTDGSSTNISNQGPFNNLGVPGIRCIDYSITGYGYFNPYAARFFSSPSTQSAMSVALASKPTFFSLWLGSNDVLGYATSGGEGAVPGLTLTDISPLAQFQQSYEALVQGLVATNAKGVLINIPDITSIPFFNTVDPKGLVLDANQAFQLNQAYAPLGITFNAGPNYFIIQDASAPGGLRQIKDGEYLLLTLPQDSLRCGGWGSLKPIPKQFVLSADEVANVKSATAAFNNVIYQEAQKYNLAYMDANSYIKTFQSGMYWDGVKYSVNFVTGGVFSLDGVHLTPRGYALVANQIIRTINEQYKSTIPLVEANKYPSVKFP